jgi:hypothetical protein
MSRWSRVASALVLSGGFFLCPSESWAKDDTPSVIQYGFDGFWTGAQIGLASGYLATGKDYDSEEWRKLVFGAGVGALVGVGLGITLGVLDVSSGPPPTGGLILRDVSYGVGLGAIVGTAVGALFLIDDGRPKNLLTGAAIGTLAGAGAGLVFGIIEGVAAGREPEPVAPGAGGRDTASVRFTLIGTGESYLPLPALQGTF